MRGFLDYSLNTIATQGLENVNYPDCYIIEWIIEQIMSLYIREDKWVTTCASINNWNTNYRAIIVNKAFSSYRSNKE